MVRPFAIAAPVVVLLLAAPLLRPLWAPGIASEREIVTLEAVRSILERGSLTLDASRLRGVESVVRVNGQLYPADAPAFPVLLASVGWVIERCGVPLKQNPVLFEYLLIFFAITLPTALSCGLIYRMARVFELKRGWRVLLALACVLATGWFSYCGVLLPFALATALVVAAAASCVHLIAAKHPMLSVGWLAGGGFCAATAAAIEPGCVFALLLMPLLVLALRHPWRVRLAGLLLVIAGSAAPIVMHASLNTAITGDLLPARWHQTMVVANPGIVAPTGLADDDDPVTPGAWLVIGRVFNRLITFTIGAHGVLSHFPILVIGFAGAGIVLHRHWTPALKWLAGGVLVILLIQVVLRMGQRLDTVDLNFAAPRLIVMLPLLLLFSGAWLRRKHDALVYTVVGIALGVSVTITLIGATAPAPVDGYSTYTAAQAVERMFDPPTPVEAIVRGR